MLSLPSAVAMSCVVFNHLSWIERLRGRTFIIAAVHERML